MNTPLATRGDLIGCMLLGRYRIVRELAKGGMGVVYLARVEGAVGFMKPVVVKLVLPEHSDDERFLRMFAREARILAQMRHPGVVDVLEFGEQDGIHVMVLEYVRGHHLGQWSRYLQLKMRHVPTALAIQIMIDVLDALEHAHHLTHPDGTSMQIVHRDVSPSNILLDENGHARLVDFGVARMRGGTLEYQTQVQSFVGKLPYTAPELCAEGEASGQSDLYACAVVLHETILQRNVFRAENQAATLHRILTHQPDPLAGVRDDVPPGLDAVLNRALAKAPNDRYASAAEFASALRDLQTATESELRARLGSLLKPDFASDLPDLLGIESLSDRDEAWRRLSSRPPRRARVTQSDGGSRREPQAESGSSGRRTDDPEPTSGPRAARSREAGVATMVSTAARKPRPSGRIPRVDPAAPNATSGASEVPATSAAAAHLPLEEATVLTPETPHHIATPRTRTPPHRLALAGGALAALAVAGAALWAREAREDLQQPPPMAPAHIAVVFQPGPGVPGSAGEPAVHEALPSPNPSVDVTTAGTAGDGAQSPTASEVPSTARTTPKLRDGARRRRTPDARALTQAFRVQEPKIQACFTAYTSMLDGQPQLRVEFDLDGAGHLDDARVLPEALATTPLGKCIGRVARATVFPTQGKTVSFSIPVTASRVSAKKPRN